MRSSKPGSEDGQRHGWIVLLIGIVLALALVAAGYVSYQNFERRYRDEVERQLSTVADLKVAELTQWRLERLGDGDLFFHNAAYSSLVRRFFQQPQDAEVQRQLRDWIGRLQAYHRYDQVLLLDTQGVQRMSLPANRPPMAAAIIELLPEVLRKGQVVFQDFYRNEHDRRIYLAVLVPLFDAADEHRPLGVLKLRIDPEDYLYPFITRWPTPSPTAETLLVRKEGRQAVFLNELRFQTNTALNLRFPLDRAELPAAQAALGRALVMDGRDYRGVPVVAALRNIPDSPWHLVARMDAAEVYAPLRARLWQTVVLIGALLLGAAAGVGLVWRQQRVRFYQARYAMAEALRASEFRYRRLFEAAKEGMLMVDAETGTIVDLNPCTLEMLGAPRERFLDRKVWETGIFQSIVADEDDFAKWRTQEFIRYDDLPVETCDGRRIAVQLVTNVYPVNHRQVIQCTLHDITAEKRVAAERAQLEAQNRQLQKSESLGRMAGAIAHHFNNQLQVVLGHLELALADLPRDGNTADSVNTAMQAAREAAKMSGLMLTYLGQAPQESKPLDLSDLCRQSLPLLHIAMPVVLETDLTAPGPVIQANANQLQQVLTNLVANALESGGTSRGAVRLAVKTVAAAEIPTAHRFPVNWRPQAQTYAGLAVVDHGLGIAAAHFDQLFDPFFSTKFTGRGLGLPVALGIVRAHGGVITVESVPGEGSVFQVFFPIVEPIVLRPTAQAGPAPALVSGGTVLLVDDEAALRKVAATMIAHLGFTVLSAQDGVEAEEVFRQHQAEIRCVLTDLTMPRRNGWETLAALRKLRTDLPVILASGYNETEVMAGEHAERPQAFLRKPYSLQELREALGRALAVR